MKKIVKYISATLAISMLALVIVSCGGSGGPSGKYEYVMGNGGDFFEFTSDNKFTHTQGSGIFKSSIPGGSGTYKINGDKITLIFDDGTENVYSYSFEKASGEESVRINGDSFLK